MDFHWTESLPIYRKKLLRCRTSLRAVHLPERDLELRREKYTFSRPRPKLRAAIKPLARYQQTWGQDETISIIDCKYIEFDCCNPS